MSPEALFWASVAFLAYTYAGYPLAVSLIARLRGNDIASAHVPEAELPTVTILIAAHDEQRNITRKLQSIAELNYPVDRVSTIVVSDGSSDDTATVARAYPRVRVIELATRSGKAVALNAGCAAAAGEFLVMTDARQQLAPGTLRALVRPFRDPRVGAVGGELVFLQSDTGVARSLNAYWTYEKFIRRAEAALGTMIGVSGAIYAMRRRDWTPLCAGTILDDLVVPMRLMRRGMRIVFEPDAQAFDFPESDLQREKRRKLRTLAGNYQAIAREPWLLVPWAYRAAWQFWSHKICRLAAPYALIGAAVGSLLASGPFYAAAAAIQAFCFLAAFLAARSPRVARNQFAALCRVFVEVHVTTARALPAFLRGSTETLWKR